MIQHPRLHSETFTALIGKTETCAGHRIEISVARLGKAGRGDVHEIVFLYRGESIEEHMATIMSDLAIATSRAVQRRDPETGEPIA